MKGRQDERPSPAVGASTGRPHRGKSVSLSDEILAHREKLAQVRHVLSQLVTELGARSAFLIDEAGVPFAAIGNVEFQFPHPMPSSEGDRSDDAVLKALLGMGQMDESSSVLLHKASTRALLVTILEQPLQGRKHREAMSRVKRAAAEIEHLIE
jgi:hypothetical protein